jgi:hypothetical protein
MANRLQFAIDELERIEEDDERLVLLAFSDKAHFHFDGGVNRHNHRYWSPENSNWVI